MESRRHLHVTSICLSRTIIDALHNDLKKLQASPRGGDKGGIRESIFFSWFPPVLLILSYFSFSIPSLFQAASDFLFFFFSSLPRRLLRGLTLGVP